VQNSTDSFEYDNSFRWPKLLLVPVFFSVAKRVDLYIFFLLSIIQITHNNTTFSLNSVRAITTTSLQKKPLLFAHEMMLATDTETLRCLFDPVLDELQRFDACELLGLPLQSATMNGNGTTEEDGAALGQGYVFACVRERRLLQSYFLENLKQLH
jgi:hypothetical protein